MNIRNIKNNVYKNKLEFIQDHAKPDRIYLPTSCNCDGWIS